MMFNRLEWNCSNKNMNGPQSVTVVVWIFIFVWRYLVWSLDSYKWYIMIEFNRCKVVEFHLFFKNSLIILGFCLVEVLVAPPQFWDKKCVERKHTGLISSTLFFSSVLNLLYNHLRLTFSFKFLLLHLFNRMTTKALYLAQISRVNRRC